jgi:hypothetical protein
METRVSEAGHDHFHAHEETHENKQGRSGLDSSADPQALGTTTVTLDDQGDKLVLMPVPDDPIEAAAGAFAGEGQGPDLETIRREEREEEAEIEERKYGI